MKTRKLFWLVPLLAALVVPAHAGNRDEGASRFEHRIERQRDRIRDGVREGDLTRHEAKTLRQEQRHITKLERRFERDGRLDRYERRTLKRELDGAGRRIAHLRHNDRYRGEGHRRHGHRPEPVYAPRYRTHHGHGRHHYDNGPYWSFVLSLSDAW
ncbi:MAG: hypothetical protein KDI88_13645 [Gammaproteobacteria bacterium]|nr:hypothetical protein [Gammaproteobacteria bacterium]